MVSIRGEGGGGEFAPLHYWNPSDASGGGRRLLIGIQGMQREDERVNHLNPRDEYGGERSYS